MDCYKDKIILPQDIKGYMVKIRKLASLEKGLEEITRILTEEEIKKAINKGGSYIRKCSDPDPDSDGIKRNIDHVLQNEETHEMWNLTLDDLHPNRRRSDKFDQCL